MHGDDHIDGGDVDKDDDSGGGDGDIDGDDALI